VWEIILMSFLGGCVNAFDQPTQQALVPDLLSRDDLASGIALNSVTWQGAALFGPSVAGLTVAWLGLAGAFYANAASYLAVVVALFLMRGVPERGANTRPRTVFGDLREGLRYARATRLVFTLLLLACTANLFGRSYQQLLPVFARDVLHAGASGLGFMTAAPGAGALLGAVFVTSTARSLEHKGRVLIVGLIGFAAGVFLLASSRNLALSLIALLISGLAFILFSTMMTTIMQLTVPGEMRGRVMSLQVVAMQGFGPIGALLVGGLAVRTGTPAAVAIGASLVGLAALAAIAFAPEVRGYSFTPVPEAVNVSEPAERPA
jgi:MFS family permease